MNETVDLPSTLGAFRYLAGLYETSTEKVLKAVLDIHQPNNTADTVKSGALSPAGLAYEIPIDTDDGPQWLEVVEREADVFTCYCTSEGFVEVSEEQQRQYHYDRLWLPRVLKTSLGISGETVTLVPEHLELLGSITLDGRPYQVLLSRQLTSMNGFNRIYQGLENWHGRAAGVVLTVSERYDHLLPLPGGYPIISIMSLLTSLGPCKIESKKLKELLRATFQPDLGLLEIEWSVQGLVGRFEANDREPWDIFVVRNAVG